MEPIPFHRPSVDESAIDEVVETIRSGWLTTGPKTRRFEEDFSRFVGARYAVAVNSATAALHLAMAALEIGAGDEVIVPTMTFASTAEVVVHLGAEPVLVDCLPDTLNVDPMAVEQAITERTRAVAVVHYAGQPADMARLMELAESHQIAIVEDAAHALPARYRGHMIGGLGDVTCFSFYANKTITTGEGGMITTNNEGLAERMRILSLHGLSSGAWNRFSVGTPWDYAIVAPGYKYNLSDIAASLGIHQLARANELQAARAQHAVDYGRHFVDSDVIHPLTVSPEVEHAWHLYVIRLQVDRLRIDRNEVIKQLGEAGIGTSVHYRPLHMHPYYRDRYGYQSHTFPAAAVAFDEVVSLPLFPDMTPQQVDRVAETLTSILVGSLR